MSFYRLSTFSLLFLLILTSCASAPTALPSTPTALATSSPQPSNTPNPTATQVPSQTPVIPTKTLVPKAQLCSPLEGLTLAQLPQILTKPFIRPTIGKDDGHTGVDFSYWSRGTRTSMLNLPVYSVLPGKVSAVLPNALPYGNAIIIETPLEELPSSWMSALQLPNPVPTAQPAPVMTCTLPTQPANWDLNKRSLYVLYAHFNQPAIVKAGDTVNCGQQIGGVGTTGMSTNYHLHFEVRVGPSGVAFGAMDYYDTSETQQETTNYCEWRISQVFQLINPMKLLSLQP